MKFYKPALKHNKRPEQMYKFLADGEPVGENLAAILADEGHPLRPHAILLVSVVKPEMGEYIISHILKSTQRVRPKHVSESEKEDLETLDDNAPLSLLKLLPRRKK